MHVCVCACVNFVLGDIAGVIMVSGRPGTGILSCILMYVYVAPPTPVDGLGATGAH